MLTSTERLRFVLFMSVGAWALFLRDSLIKLIAPHSEIARSRRVAAEYQTPFISQSFIQSARQSIEVQLAVPTRQPTAMVLLCHGIGERFYFWREVQHLLAASGIGSLVFHYPGYGRSTGQFTPENVDASAQAAYEHLRVIASEAPVFIFGTSLGTAVAAHVSAILNPSPAGLILAQGFTTLREAAAKVLHLAYLPSALSKLLPDVWQNTQSLTEVSCPILIVHGASDFLFPVSMGEELFKAAQSRKGGEQSLLTPEGFDHSDPMLGFAVEAYWQPILDFIRSESHQCSK
jgi:alpha-beta hydrolase superfamily lysophospholipase